MSVLRRYLLARAAAYLNEAEAGLHMVPQMVELHRQIRDQLYGVDGSAPLGIVLHLWWCAYCIKGCVRHSIRAGACRR